MTDQDHDLLVQIHTKLERALIDIKELKDDTVNRIDRVEIRVSTLENWRWYIVGIASVLTVIVNFAINKYLK